MNVFSSMSSRERARSEQFPLPGTFLQYSYEKFVVLLISMS